LCGGGGGWLSLRAARAGGQCQVGPAAWGVQGQALAAPWGSWQGGGPGRDPPAQGHQDAPISELTQGFSLAYGYFAICFFFYFSISHLWMHH